MQKNKGLCAAINQGKDTWPKLYPGGEKPAGIKGHVNVS